MRKGTLAVGVRGTDIIVLGAGLQAGYSEGESALSAMEPVQHLLGDIEQEKTGRPQPRCMLPARQSNTSSVVTTQA